MRRVLTLVLLLATAAGTTFPGCSIEESTHKKALLNRIQPPQPILAGTATYGGGVLTAECWLGPSVRLKKTNNNAETAGQPDHGDRQAQPDSAASNHFESSECPFEQGPDSFSPKEIEAMYGRVNYDNVLAPRLALTFRFTNTSAGRLRFTIADVNSALGNFAPRPETFLVEPGRQGSVDPMLSNFDINFEGLDVTLSVRINGTTETHVLNLRRAPDAAAPARRD